MNSREKGKRGELELAHRLTELGFKARRGQQYSGTETSADVLAEGLESFHLECKRTEKTQLWDWMEQAIHDSGKSGKTPLVIHRKSRGDWLVILRIEDFAKLILGV